MRLALLTLIGCLAASTPLFAQLISEFEPNPPGADPTNVDFEISGTAGQTFVGTIISLESDGFGGTVDRIASVSGTFDANGLLVVNIPDFENPSFTIALLGTDNSLVLNQDLDADGDGTIDDISLLGTIYDAIGIPDSEADATAGLYGATLGGQDFAFTGDEPKSVFRDGVSGAWYAINDPDGGLVFDINAANVPAADFDTDPLVVVNTFGAINPSLTTAPISLLAIEVAKQRQAAVVSWTTSFETGNDYFAIERSADGRQFEVLGRLAGAGDTQIEQSYAFVDNEPLEGLSYYRLRQVDFDETQTIYGPIAFRNTATGPQPTIFPNPATDFIQLNTLDEEVSELHVLDAQGRSILQLSNPLAKSNPTLNVSQLPKGMYFLRFVQQNELVLLRFIKQ